ncbi:ANTAR domain-containing protein [Streptomyces sp. VRA16 Mangrove soil]|uniref:ANTAR domain-containing protein n=1 Tax=Streptomyces sp. VRA16 Mangrove soil TaxID=2817434 RepID=UPI001A9CCE2F|nr:ANTAR domain-containing protein [Streptomyces sp. VRA16 Mangrove soil]MBO1332266.1 ANTAR domain-containing protein [Streptomyces sp. VRA16 Mangrove soil]
MQPDARDPEPGSDAPHSPARQLAELEAEVARLRAALHARAVIDQAVGVILALGRMTPAEAWDVLREVSMRTDIPVQQVARMLVDHPRTGPIPQPVRGELERQLIARREEAAPQPAPARPPAE